MSHANILELDEAAAGIASAPLREHLQACEQCRAELARVSRERSELVATARFNASLAQLPEARPRRRWPWALLPVAAMGIAALLFWPAPARLRVKGDAFLQLVSPEGAPRAAPRAGDLLTLRIAPGTHRFALVIATEDKTVLWPPGSTQSGPLAPGEHAAVSIRMTPGPTHVVGAFSDRPLSIAEALGDPPDAELRTLDVVTSP